MFYEDHQFYTRNPGILSKKNPKANIPVKKKKDKIKNQFKDNYAAGDDPLTVDLFQDFEIIEGRSFKGHSAPINDLIKVGNSQYATCDENGMIVIWSKAKN
jgi:hypothetical protein